MKRFAVCFLLATSLGFASNTIPTACVATVAVKGSLCVSDLHWISGHDDGTERIVGEFRNNTSITLPGFSINFPIYDAKDRIVIWATAYINTPILAGDSVLFAAPVSQPVGTGLFSVTLYTNRAKIEVGGDSADIRFDTLFTSGNVLGVRKYKKQHGT